MYLRFCCTSRRLVDACQKIREQVGRIIVGQDDVIEQLLIAILARGHCLLEGVPGLAKTLMVRSLGFEFVFVEGEVVFPPADAQYHLRRALYTYENFPAVLLFDPYINLYSFRKCSSSPMPFFKCLPSTNQPRLWS